MLLSYLKQHYRIILLLALFTVIYITVFSLYDLPVSAVLYAAVLCLFTGLILFCIGYLGYLHRHRCLSAMLSQVRSSLDGLSQPSDTIEEDYQELLKLLFAEKSKLEAAASSARREMLDYYTLWAHQIKTPIAAMQLLMSPEDTALSAELFKIEQYVEMVLSYLRLDSESSDYLLKEYALDDIVRQAVRKYAGLFILKKLPLEFKESGRRIVTDEKWLLFVIEQLLSNALKYTFSGKIGIYCRGNQLVIEDTGIGIRPEDLPRVFENGFTGYNGREDKKSTGIGLYLCQRVCKKLGCGISIESEVGLGTRVLLTLADKSTMYE